MQNVEADQARVKIAELKAVIGTVVRYRHSIAILSLSADMQIRCQLRSLPSGERGSKLVLESSSISRWFAITAAWKRIGRVVFLSPTKQLGCLAQNSNWKLNCTWRALSASMIPR